MSNIALPFTFVNGAGHVIDADQVNANFSEVAGVVNGGLGSGNLDATAKISHGEINMTVGNWALPTTATLIPGMTATVSPTVPSLCQIAVTVGFLGKNDGSSNLGVLQAELYVDGTKIAPYINGGTAVALLIKATLGGCWQVPLAPGAHTIEMRGWRNAYADPGNYIDSAMSHMLWTLLPT